MTKIPLQTRRKTRTAVIGTVKLGHEHPVAIQSMCSTKTENVDATVAQILELEREGCELIRVAVPTAEAAEALSEIKRRIHIPLIADIHFDARLALAALDHGADKIRINPGNIKQSELLEQIIAKAETRNACLRIGVNAGSLESDLLDKYGSPAPEAMVESALRWLEFFETRHFKNLVVSLKSTQIPDMIRANELLAEKCDVPLHIGVTEAGLRPEGSIKNAVGCGALLSRGIGDTIRVSVSDDPVFEIETCKIILKSLKLYTKEPDIIACPTCGRTEIDVVNITEQVKSMIRSEGIKGDLRIAVMGCVVNGLGEAKEADFAIAGGRKQGNIYCKGELYKGNIPENCLSEEFRKMIRLKLTE